MSASSLLLFVKATQHALATAAVAASPTEEPSPKQLAGDFLPVRYIGVVPVPTGSAADARVMVPTDQLDVVSVPAQSVPVGEIHLIANKKEKTAAAVNMGNALNDAKFNSTRSGIEVEFTALSTAKVTVWARLERVPSSLSSVLPTGVTCGPVDVTPASVGATVTASLPAQGVGAGHYWALVLATDFAPLMKELT